MSPYLPKKPFPLHFIYRKKFLLLYILFLFFPLSAFSSTHYKVIAVYNANGEELDTTDPSYQIWYASPMMINLYGMEAYITPGYQTACFSYPYTGLRDNRGWSIYAFQDFYTGMIQWVSPITGYLAFLLISPNHRYIRLGMDNCILEAELITENEYWGLKRKAIEWQQRMQPPTDYYGNGGESSEIECYSCKGTGACSNCNGTGKYEYMSNGICPVCHGSGICTSCRGKGKI